MKMLLLLALLPTALISQQPGRPATRSARQSSAKSLPAKPTSRSPAYGAKADSLRGIAGHVFGEPRSNFPELQVKGYPDIEGYTYYQPKQGQAQGWFGKNADYVTTTYRFYQDKFAAFTALASGPNRQLLADETDYLFGKGQSKGVVFGELTVQWEGTQVRVSYTDGHNDARLNVISKPVLAQMAADKLARQQAEAAARAAKLKADNAP